MLKKITSLMIAFTVIAMSLSFSGCASKSQQVKKGSEYSGFLQSYPSFEKGMEDIDKRYLKNGVDFSQYDKVMMDEVVFYFKHDVEYKGIKPSEIQELGEEFHKAFVKEMGDVLTADPGPNVMRMRLAVTDIEPSNPVSGTLTTVIPVGLAVSLVKKGASGSYTGIGSASMEVEFLDSQTGERIAAAIDQAPGDKLDVGKLSPARAAFEYWAKRLHAFMNEVK
jgi:hypothetical protein